MFNMRRKWITSADAECEIAGKYETPQSNKEAAAAAAAIARPEVLGREGWANRTRTSAAPQLPQETVGRMQRRDGQKGEEEELSRDDRRRCAVREPLKPRLNQHSFTASNGDPNSSRYFRQGCEALK